MITPRLPAPPRLPDGGLGFILSADGGAHLARAAADLAVYLRRRPDAVLENVAAALASARDLRRNRALIHTDDRAVLLTALDALAAGSPAPGLHTGRAGAGKTVFVFPGQGSQRRGMGAMLHRLAPAYRARVDEIHQLSMSLFGSSPRDYLLGTGDWAGDRASGTGGAPVEVVQPAIFMQALGIAAMWRAAGIAPGIHLGHSQGEIAAAVAAGIITTADGLRLVTGRARAVRDHAPTGHSMAVIGADRERCAAMLARVTGFAEISVVNSAHVLCVSGERGVVTGLVERAGTEGVFAREIRVEYPAHTSLVGTLWHLKNEWMGGLDNDRFLVGDALCFGGTLGTAITPDLDPANYWFWNLRNPVRFDLATAAAIAAGGDRFIEIAEHPTLALALLENIAANPGAEAAVTGTSRRDAPDLGVFASAVADVVVGHAADLTALRGGTGIPAHAPAGLADDLPARLPADFPPPPMLGRRLWAPRPLPAPGPRGRFPRILATAWRVLDVQVTAAPRPLVVLDPTGTRAELARALVSAAARYGAIARLGDRAEPHEAAVILTPAGTDPDTGTGAGAETDAQIAAVGQFLADRTWWAGTRPAAAITVITDGAVGNDGAAPAPVQAAIVAGLRAFAADLPGIPVAHVDLDPGLDPADQAGLAVHAAHLEREPRLALRGGAILAERWVPGPTGEPAPMPAHVLITGGTGHLGLAMAADAAARGAVTVTLLSRSGDTPAARVALAPVRRRYRTEVEIVACDITSPSGIAEALAGRPVDLIVHTALGYHHAAAGNLGAEQFAGAAGAKVAGLMNLLAAAPGAAVVAAGSAATALPGAGQAWYAAANALQDAVLAAQRRAGRNAVSVRWGLWEQAGPLDAAQFAAVTATGMIPMAAPDALAAAAKATGTEPVILAADLPRLRALAGALGADAILAELDEPAPVPVPDEPGAANSRVAESRDPESRDPEPADSGTGQPGTPGEDAGPDVETVLRGHLGAVLALPPGDLDRDIALVALGLDSLQALELRTAVRADLGIEIPLEDVLGGATLADVTATVSAR